MEIQNLMSYLKIVFALPVPVFLYLGMPVWASAFIIISLLMDADGTVARLSGKETKEGGKLDIITDVISAGIVLLGMFLTGYLPLWWVALLVAIVVPVAYLFGKGEPLEEKTFIEKALSVSTYLLTIPLILFPQYSMAILLVSIPMALASSFSMVYRVKRKR